MPAMQIVEVSGRTKRSKRVSHAGDKDRKTQKAVKSGVCSLCGKTSSGSVVLSFSKVESMDVSSAKHTEHVPDPTRLPACVTGWKEVDPARLWEDGTQILVAVPVCSRGESWYYEFSVVVIRCDEGYFEIETSDGDAWGWDLDSIDFYVELGSK